MLAYLLDEHLSPGIAQQLQAKDPAIPVVSVFHWRSGALVGQPDSLLLAAAFEDRLTLVTYDLRTIPDLLQAVAAEQVSHAGVLFVDEATLRFNDYGGLIRALLAHWHRYHTDDWTDRVAFLTPR